MIRSFLIALLIALAIPATTECYGPYSVTSNRWADGAIGGGVGRLISHAFYKNMIGATQANAVALGTFVVLLAGFATESAGIRNFSKYLVGASVAYALSFHFFPVDEEKEKRECCS